MFYVSVNGKGHFNLETEQKEFAEKYSVKYIGHFEKGGESGTVVLKPRGPEDEGRGSRFSRTAAGTWIMPINLHGKVKSFGKTPISTDNITEFNNGVIHVKLPPMNLRKPMINRRRQATVSASKPSPRPDIDLQDAIKAVNGHKDRLGSALKLRIDGSGHVRGNIEL